MLLFVINQKYTNHKTRQNKRFSYHEYVARIWAKGRYIAADMKQSGAKREINQRPLDALKISGRKPTYRLGVVKVFRAHHRCGWSAGWMCVCVCIPMMRTRKWLISYLPIWIDLEIQLSKCNFLSIKQSTTNIPIYQTLSNLSMLYTNQPTNSWGRPATDLVE